MPRTVDRQGGGRRETLAEVLGRIAPDIPRFEREAVLDHALDSEGLRKSAPDTAVWLSLVAFVRHQLTDYDDLLGEGYDPDSARHAVAEDMRKVLRDWGIKRSLS